MNALKEWLDEGKRTIREISDAELQAKTMLRRIAEPDEALVEAVHQKLCETYGLAYVRSGEAEELIEIIAQELAK